MRPGRQRGNDLRRHAVMTEGLDMGRVGARLFGFAAVLWLAAGGFAQPAGQQAKPAETKVAAPPPVPVVGFRLDALPAGVDDAQVQQFEQQYGRQVRLLYRTELHFLRSVCQPTKEQYDKIAADGETVLKAAVRQYAEVMFGRMPAQSDARAPIASALAKLARQTLPPDQAARYQKELDERAAARKRVMLRTLLNAVDRVLFLSDEQRVQLGEILEANWHSTWNHSQWLMYAGQYFPSMPDAKILPILTETQKTVWRGIPKGNIGFSFDLDSIPGIDIGDEIGADGPGPAGGAVPRGIPKSGAKK